MKKSIMILAASLSLATLGACDGATENAQEDQADAVRENAEVQADDMQDKILVAAGLACGRVVLPVTHLLWFSLPV